MLTSTIIITGLEKLKNWVRWHACGFFGVCLFFFRILAFVFSRRFKVRVGAPLFSKSPVTSLGWPQTESRSSEKKSKLDGPREESCSGVRDATGEILGSYLYKSLLHFSHAFTCATENTPLPIESASQRRRLTAIRKSIGDPRLFLRLWNRKKGASTVEFMRWRFLNRFVCAPFDPCERQNFRNSLRLTVNRLALRLVGELERDRHK